MDINGDGASDYSPNKIFEQTGITGENTYFQTHLSWYGAESIPIYFPQEAFYLDVDFYNESAQPVTLEIKNLANGLSYNVMGEYYTESELCQIIQNSIMISSLLTMHLVHLIISIA